MGKLDYDTGHHRWKGLQFNYDDVRAESDDRCLFCLTKQQVAFLLASLEPAKWKTRWYSLTDQVIDTDWLDATFSALEAELMTDHCDIDAALTTINNNITNVQTSVTNVQNNLTIVQNNLTLVENNVVNIQVQNTTLNFITILNIYNTFTSAKTDTTKTQVYARYNAFCSAILRWITDITFRRMSEISATASQTVTVFNMLNTLGGGILGNIFGGNPSSYALAVLYTAITSVPDTEAVACWMVTTLSSKQPTFLAFSAALLGFTPANTNQTVLQSILLSALAFEGAFTSFAGILDQEYSKALALNPTDFSCYICSTPGGCGYQTWDFTQLQLPPWTIKRGQLVSGQGIVGVPVPGDASYAFEANLYFPSGCKPIVTTYIHFTLLGLPNNTNNSFYFETYAIVAGVETLQEWSFYISQASYPTPITTSKEWTFGPLVNYKTLSRIRIVSNTFFNTPSGGNWITPTYSALQKVVLNGVP